MQTKKYLVTANAWCIAITLFFAGYLLLFSPFVAIRHESAEGPERIAQITDAKQLRDECETMALELQGAFVRRTTDLPIFAVYILFVLSIGGANLLLLRKISSCS